MPAILLLLIVGFIAGPVTGVLDPDEVFGGLLFPLISFAVAVILFEGGLTLRLDHLPHVGAVLRRLLSIGALATWFVGTLGAHFIVGIHDWGVALLLGAILIVTGPTVIGPLLRHVRPTSKISSILNWAGIVIDPIGAVTLGTKLTLQEKLFLSWMAPRGIVAAAVSSIFAQRLLSLEEPMQGAASIVPVTVVIIVGTVALYGLTASFVAKKLGIAKPAPNGVILVGAHPWARRIAEALKKANIIVLMVDTDVNKIAAAKMAGLSA